MTTTTNLTQVKENKNLFEKIKDHKKEILVTSAVLCATIVGVLIYKKLLPKVPCRIKENIPRVLGANNELSESESKLPVTSNIIESPVDKTSNIPGHPRNLPLGHNPSEKQLEITKNLGVTLAENQTYVTDYCRKIA